MMAAYLFLLLATAAQSGQSNTGELRVSVADPSGLPLQCTVALVSEANQVTQRLETDADGTLVARRLPFGKYRVEVSRNGFAKFTGLVRLQ